MNRDLIVVIRREATAQGRRLPSSPSDSRHGMIHQRSNLIMQEAKALTEKSESGVGEYRRLASDYQEQPVASDAQGGDGPMHQANILRIVVASPSDVQAERDALPGIVDELDHGIAGEHGLRLELARWETDAYPGFHPPGPQGLIDALLRIEDCDILIGLFWKRFGTPMPDANSGTEHEFRRAL
jgi:hypothetical protein